MNTMKPLPTFIILLIIAILAFGAGQIYVSSVLVTPDTLGHIDGDTHAIVGAINEIQLRIEAIQSSLSSIELSVTPPEG